MLLGLFFLPTAGCSLAYTVFVFPFFTLPPFPPAVLLIVPKWTTMSLFSLLSHVRPPCSEWCFLVLELIFYEISRIYFMWHTAWSLPMFPGHFPQLTSDFTEFLLFLNRRSLSPPGLRCCFAHHLAAPHSLPGGALLHPFILSPGTASSKKLSLTFASLLPSSRNFQLSPSVLAQYMRKNDSHSTYTVL